MRPAVAHALPAPLRRAYARTDYTAEAGRILAHAGRRSATLDAWMRRHGVRAACFVGAWNPLGRRLPHGANDRRHALLRAAARRLPAAEGWGLAQPRLPRRGDAAPHWAERHLLLGAAPARGAALGRRFRQNAILVARRGAPARLLALRAA